MTRRTPRSTRMTHSFPTLRSSDLKSHERVGGATVFGAGAAIAAGLGRLQHQARGAAGDHVHLAAQRRNPERVNHIGAVEQQLGAAPRSEEHTSELQSLMRISYAVFCLKKNKKK